MSSESKVITAHFNVNVRVNDYESRWSDPSAEQYFQFAIPVELFDPARVAKMLEAKMKEVQQLYFIAVKEVAEKLAQENANA